MDGWKKVQFGQIGRVFSGNSINAAEKTTKYTDCYHFNFEIEGVDSLVLAEALAEEGWIVSSTENPNSIQLMITVAHEGVAPEFCAAVSSLSDDIRSGKRKGSGKQAVYSKVLLKDQPLDV